MHHIFIASIIDIFFGDPYKLPHPVKAMGHIITFEEKIIRNFFLGPMQLQIAGLFMTIINIFLGFCIPYLLLYHLNGLAFHILSIYIIYTSISGRMLAFEANKVKKALKINLEKARRQLSYIVGRDTKCLSAKEIILAVIETVSENTSDGLVAPLFYITLFGPAGGWMYKFVNTMDSMVGYRNDKYEDLGKASALIDDIFNFIPARITAFLMIFYGLRGGGFLRSIKIVKRDHKNHLSPNAGYPESAVAGLLGIRLGGGHYYFGEFVEKPTIGDPLKEVDLCDIDRAISILYFTMFFATFIGSFVYKFIHI